MFGYYFLEQNPSKLPESTLNDSTIVEATGVFNFEDRRDNYNIKILKYTDSLKDGNKLQFLLGINKDYLLNYYADEISVCLVALDYKNQIIDAIKKDKGPCYYSLSGENYPLAISTIPIDSTNVSFELPPV